MAALFKRTSGLAILVHGPPRSLLALFSPKLWTVLNQYGAGGPFVTGAYEWPLGIKFEDLSLGGKLRCENSMRVAQLLAPKRTSRALDPIGQALHWQGGDQQRKYAPNPGQTFMPCSRSDQDWSIPARSVPNHPLLEALSSQLYRQL